MANLICNGRELDWVRRADGAWEYELTSLQVFRELTRGDFGYFRAYSKKHNRLLVQGRGDLLFVFPGYRYDGCTVVGRVYENEHTLKAACLHDIMYQIARQKGYRAAWTLRHADKLFLWTLKRYGVSWLIRNLWYAGIKCLGGAWKLNTLDTLVIHDD